MTMTTAPNASSSVEVQAAPETVYAIITDLDLMAELAEETSRMRWAKGGNAAPGAVFKGTNRNGWRRWTTKCTVTDADPGRCFAFHVSHAGIPVSRWQYDITASPEGCTLTESTWDRRPGWYRRPASFATGVPTDRSNLNAENIQATLRRIKARAEAGS